MGKFIWVLVLVLMIIGYCIVSTWSYEDELRQYQHCLNMVELNVWPEDQCK